MKVAVIHKHGGLNEFARDRAHQLIAMPERREAFGQRLLAP